MRLLPRTNLLKAHHASNFLRNRTVSSEAIQLKVLNSLNGELESLPRENAVHPHVLRWYSCGPTVYDRAHLGHARAYVSQDILRRILEKKFNYNVFLVMGVTDVDDKIIKRAKENGVSFVELARNEEEGFFKDMESLYVQKPNAITRVSEHMDEIIKYVAQIQKKQFAYEAHDGSGVYFDTQSLGDAYGKLSPEKHAHISASDIQERDLDNYVNKTKKNTRDFALWKTSKEKGEPSWASPWGKGRPGWHIECSAMTHYVLGDRLDIHSGGIDLRFPHHNNEIAQCEAHNGCSHWCNHFIHFGHLYIQGLKMSKSLKNFISIRDFLEKHSADEFRLFCLQFKYRSNIHYSDDRVRDASSISYRIKSFLSNVKAYANEQKQKALEGRAKSRCEPKDLEMLNFLFQTKVNVDAALANDFDTPEALRRILELISRTNEYIITSNEVPIETLYSVVKYVLEIIDLFGLEGILKEYSQVSHFFHLLTHEQQSRHDSNCSNNKSNEAILNTFIKFRAAVRGAALQNHDRSAGEILKLCDQVRNEDLIGLGIQVEDIAPGRSVFKFISKEKLNEKKIAEDKELARKEAEKKALLEKQKEFEHLMQISPKDFFTLSLEYIGKYTQFDEEGVPTHDSEGNELTKSQKKKLRKKLEKHTKSYDKFWKNK